MIAFKAQKGSEESWPFVGALMTEVSMEVVARRQFIHER